MGKFLLTASARRPCALCAAAVTAFAIAAATAGCAEQVDYVKPSATTATLGRTSETAAQETVQVPAAGSGASAAHE